ncbi:hypothetical protein [Mycoplasma sp. Mirounga ES2805-ORL]|uniref:hypothetical protein n=1 Tax=Mycoplasma sp. Mirounga ES2805-ORL TaxID=754514 RepID=UPI00197CAAC3|nr:hypothetical protein [Mycoplasma sp. Mirounga ES2805-ORL]QSF13926.1 hypothetical protein JXZ90_01350 [Mycoplasma sp. Mirounga ES2805-ORL]
MKKRKILLSSLLSITSLPLAAVSCNEKFPSLNEINHAKKIVNIFANDSSVNFIGEAALKQTDDVEKTDFKFNNAGESFDKERYVFEISKITKKETSIDITYYLLDKKTGAKSDFINKTISGFMKNPNSESHEINDELILCLSRANIDIDVSKVPFKKAKDYLITTNENFFKLNEVKVGDLKNSNFEYSLAETTPFEIGDFSNSLIIKYFVRSKKDHSIKSQVITTKVWGFKMEQDKLDDLVKKVVVEPNGDKAYNATTLKSKIEEITAFNKANPTNKKEYSCLKVKNFDSSLLEFSIENVKIKSSSKNTRILELTIKINQARGNKEAFAISTKTIEPTIREQSNKEIIKRIANSLTLEFLKNKDSKEIKENWDAYKSSNSNSSKTYDFVYDNSSSTYKTSWKGILNVSIKKEKINEILKNAWNDTSIISQDEKKNWDNNLDKYIQNNNNILEKITIKYSSMIFDLSSVDVEIRLLDKEYPGDVNIKKVVTVPTYHPSIKEWKTKIEEIKSDIESNIKINWNSKVQFNDPNDSKRISNFDANELKLSNNLIENNGIAIKNSIFDQNDIDIEYDFLEFNSSSFSVEDALINGKAYLKVTISPKGKYSLPDLKPETFLVEIKTHKSHLEIQSERQNKQFKVKRTYEALDVLEELQDGAILSVDNNFNIKKEYGSDVILFDTDYSYSSGVVFYSDKNDTNSINQVKLIKKLNAQNKYEYGLKYFVGYHYNMSGLNLIDYKESETVYKDNIIDLWNWEQLNKEAEKLKNNFRSKNTTHNVKLTEFNPDDIKFYEPSSGIPKGLTVKIDRKVKDYSQNGIQVDFWLDAIDDNGKHRKSDNAIKGFYKWDGKKDILEELINESNYNYYHKIQSNISQLKKPSEMKDSDFEFKANHYNSHIIDPLVNNPNYKVSISKLLSQDNDILGVTAVKVKITLGDKSKGDITKEVEKEYRVDKLKSYTLEEIAEFIDLQSTNSTSNLNTIAKDAKYGSSNNFNVIFKKQNIGSIDNFIQSSLNFDSNDFNTLATDSLSNANGIAIITYKFSKIDNISIKKEKNKTLSGFRIFDRNQYLNSIIKNIRTNKNLTVSNHISYSWKNNLIEDDNLVNSNNIQKYRDYIDQNIKFDLIFGNNQNEEKFNKIVGKAELKVSFKDTSDNKLFNLSNFKVDESLVNELKISVDYTGSISGVTKSNIVADSVHNEIDSLNKSDFDVYDDEGIIKSAYNIISNDKDNIKYKLELINKRDGQDIVSNIETRSGILSYKLSLIVNKFDETSSSIKSNIFEVKTGKIDGFKLIDLDDLEKYIASNNFTLNYNYTNFNEMYSAEYFKYTTNVNNIIYKNNTTSKLLTSISDLFYEESQTKAIVYNDVTSNLLDGELNIGNTLFNIKLVNLSGNTIKHVLTKNTKTYIKGFKKISLNALAEEITYSLALKNPENFYPESINVLNNSIKVSLKGVIDFDKHCPNLVHNFIQNTTTTKDELDNTLRFKIRLTHSNNGSVEKEFTIKNLCKPRPKINIDDFVSKMKIDYFEKQKTESQYASENSIIITPKSNLGTQNWPLPEWYNLAYEIIKRDNDGGKITIKVFLLYKDILVGQKQVDINGFATSQVNTNFELINTNKKPSEIEAFVKNSGNNPFDKIKLKKYEETINPEVKFDSQNNKYYFDSNNIKYFISIEVVLADDNKNLIIFKADIYEHNQVITPHHSYAYFEFNTNDNKVSKEFSISLTGESNKYYAEEYEYKKPLSSVSEPFFEILSLDPKIEIVNVYNITSYFEWNNIYITNKSLVLNVLYKEIQNSKIRSKIVKYENNKAFKHFDYNDIINNKFKVKVKDSKKQESKTLLERHITDDFFEASQDPSIPNWIKPVYRIERQDGKIFIIKELKNKEETITYKTSREEYKEILHYEDFKNSFVAKKWDNLFITWKYDKDEYLKDFQKWIKGESSTRKFRWKNNKIEYFWGLAWYTYLDIETMGNLLNEEIIKITECKKIGKHQLSLTFALILNNGNTYSKKLTIITKH